MIDLELSPKQKGAIGAALTTVSVVFVAAVVIAILAFIVNFFTFFSSVFLPLAVAGILATLLKPYYNWLFSRVKSSTLSIIIIFLSLLIPVGLLSAYFGAKLVEQIVGFIKALPVWIDSAQVYIQDHLPAIRDLIEKYDLKEKAMGLFPGDGSVLGESAKKVGGGIFATGAIVFEQVAGLLSWVVMPIYFFFMIKTPVVTWSQLEENMPFFKERTRKDVVYLISEFVGILVAFFRGQLIVAFCQGLMFAIGFVLVGLPHGFVIGLVLGFLNIIPYLGNIIGLAVVIPLAWFHPSGGLNLLVGVGIIFTIVQCVEGYILTPRIMGEKTGLHPMAIIFAIFFWGTALQGLLGMILAIPLTAFLVVFWRLARKNYIKEWF